jgi:hypothetical protein
MCQPHRSLSRLLLIAVLVSGCRESPAEPNPEHPLFERYIALGNSITSGFESEGINDSTQNNAYSVMFARRFNAPFTFVRIRKPGCPAPLLGPIALTADRVGGARVTDCALIHLPLPRLNHSLAVPGIKLADALAVPSSTGRDVFDLFIIELYRLIFGSRSLVGAMINANPTLVSVWLGQNDVLSAMTSGDIALMTSLPDFEASLDQLVAAIAGQTSAQDVVWLSVLNPLVSPLVQPGAYYWIVAQNEATRPWLRGKSVHANCAPLLPGSLPNPLAANLVSGRVLSDPAVGEISCAADASYLLTAEEQAAISNRVSAFNTAIQTRVAAHGWIYIDTNAVVAPQLTNRNSIRKCQDLLAARSEAELQAAVVASCPHPDAPNFFGALVSHDAIHPSAGGQQLIAERMEAAIRLKHGIGL